MTNTGKSPVTFNMTVTPRGIGSVTGAPRTGERPPPPPPPPPPKPPHDLCTLLHCIYIKGSYL